MSDGDRSVSTALAVTLSLALAWGLGVWAGTYNEAKRNYYQYQESSPYSGLLDRSSFWKEHSGSPESYQAVCDSPIDETQADLCQQWRSANSAEQTAGYALVSVIFGLAGLVGLGITVRISNKATDAATKATEAAVRSADAADKAYLADTRPAFLVSDLKIGSLEPELFDKPNVPFLYKFTNHGKGLGWITSLSIWIEIADSDKEPTASHPGQKTSTPGWPVVQGESWGTVRLDDNQTFTLDTADREKIVSGHRNLYVIGVFQYQPIDRSRTYDYRFVHQYIAGQDRFVPLNHPFSNYT